jgi:serine/threonine-protein kinase RsbT
MREDSVSLLERNGSNIVSLRVLDTGLRTEGNATTVKIETQRDIVQARQVVRAIAQECNCSTTQETLLATVISELARNIILYASSGKMSFRKISEADSSGVQIKAIDNGPGIPNITRAMMNGFSTSGGLGIGLAGVRQIADVFTIRSKPGQGVEVNVVMWFQKS